MDFDPNLSMLTRSMKVESSLLQPKSWESVYSETSTDPLDEDRRPNMKPQDISDHNGDTASVSEAALVRLVLNALRGLKSAIIAIEKLSISFGLTPAFRADHLIHNMWKRSSSTVAIGKILKAIGQSGLVVYFLQRFVEHYLTYSPNICDDYQGRRGTVPPYSLINQAFAVAVGKVLEGYARALDTLFSSVKHRHNPDNNDVPANFVHSEITVLEVYLHTKELRMHIEALGNICFPQLLDGSLSELAKENWAADAEVRFDGFPRGVELLTYLYVQLRDVDPVHCELLKFLFLRSYQPYYGFIKSWIYLANVDDPFDDFFVLHPDQTPAVNSVSPVGFSSAPLQGLDYIHIPCFLKDVCCPLIRAGQQLQVLIKLIQLCNLNKCDLYEGPYPSSGLVNLEDILPFWGNSLQNSPFSLTPLTFSREDLRTLMDRREKIHKKILEKIHMFFTQMEIRQQKVKVTLPAFIDKQSGTTTSFFLHQRNMILFPTGGQGAADVGKDINDNEDFSTFNGSSDADPFCSSECSSFSSSEEDDTSEEISALPDPVSQPAGIIFSSLTPSYTGKAKPQDPSEADRFSDHYSHKNSKAMDCENPIVKDHSEQVNLSFSSVQNFSGFKRCHEEYRSVRCWPLGGLVKNPLNIFMKCSGSVQMTNIDNQDSPDDNMESIEAESSYFSEMFVPFNEDTRNTSLHRKMQISKGMYEYPCNYRSCCSHGSYDLSTKPRLIKSKLIPNLSNSNETSIRNLGSYSYYDFSAVSNPLVSHFENEGSSYIVTSPSKSSSYVTSCGSIQRENIGYVEVVKHDMSSQINLGPACSLKEGNVMGESQGVSGGADSQKMLQYTGGDFMFAIGDTKLSSLASFEIPLDIIIDKCILQEILLQYEYVSGFTIKLLEEGFDLHGHLLVLQRYHFMEVADWADSFVLLLRNHKWHGAEPEEQVAQIHGLLDLALQRSSCQSDPYKNRLFLHMKEQTVEPFGVARSGIHAFDFVALGYKVDWPISIILSPGTLKMYAEIFSYLIRVRLAAFSLTDIWNFLKNLFRSSRRGRYVELGKMKYVKVLIQMRQKINQFVSSLQQYVHSQLSHVSWHQFQHSLNHQVKDMFDLESVHMSHLDDALHICFLTDEAKPLAIIIENILQCAMDFRSCLSGTFTNIQWDGADSDDLLYNINFSQVFDVKAAFERNLQDLYLLYLRSPGQGGFSFSHFWNSVNFNKCYSMTSSIV